MGADLSRFSLALSCFAGLIVSALQSPVLAQTQDSVQLGSSPGGRSPSGRSHSGRGTQGTKRFADPRSVTFASIHQAASENALDIRQTRRVLQTDTTPHQWVNVVESLQVDPTPAGSTPRFALSFVDILGANLTATQKSQRSAIYAKHAGYLFERGAFHITDPKAAAQNYTLHYLGSGYRIQREAHSFVFVPKALDRSIWLVEFDVVTGYPLASAEFDASGHRIGGVETTQFAKVTTHATTTKWWKAKNLVGEYATAVEAMRTMPMARFVFPSQKDLPSGYGFQKASVTKSDNGPEISLVMLYSDGLDDFFIAETLNGFAPNLPTVPLGSTETPYAIMSYQNENVAQYTFYQKGVNFLVLGHGSQAKLGDLTADLLVGSLTK